MRRNDRAHLILLQEVAISGIVTLHKAFELLTDRYARMSHRDCWRIFQDHENWVYVERGTYRRIS